MAAEVQRESKRASVWNKLASEEREGEKTHQRFECEVGRESLIVEKRPFEKGWRSWWERRR